MTLTRCPVCDTLSEESDKFCTGCGARLQLDDPYSTSLPPVTVMEIPWGRSAAAADQIQSGDKPGPAVASGRPVLLEVAVDADGNLPICPKCNKMRLIWEKQPASAWVHLCFAFGIPLIVACIGIGFYYDRPLTAFGRGLVLLGILLSAIGMSGLLSGRKVDPYCPTCKQFFQRQP